MSKKKPPKLRPAQPKDFLHNPRGLLGGNLEEFPQPVVWFWPGGKVKRKVRCQVISWVGSSVPGASHYYGRVVEEANWAWNGQTWCQPWHAPFSSTGRSFDKGFSTRESAIRYINKILKRFFSVETHEIEDMYN